MVMLQSAVGSITTYYTGPASIYNNPTSCPVAPCPACPLGNYSSGCGGLVSSGQCGQCQPLPDGAVWDQPSYSLPCSWACSSSTTLVNGACAAIGSYAATVTVALPLTVAQVTSNIQGILASFESLAGCGTCPVVSAIPANGIKCSSCQLSVTATAISTSRRLLAVQTNLVVSIVQGSSAASATTVSGLTAASINTQLSVNKVNAAASVVVSAVQLVVAPPPTTQAGQLPATTAIIPTQAPPATTQAAIIPTQTPPATQAPSATTQAPPPATQAPSATTQAPSATTQAPPPATQSPPPATLPPATEAAPAPAPSSSSSSNGAIIGGAVGGVVAVLVIIGVVVYFAVQAPAQTATAIPAPSAARVSAGLERGQRNNTLIYTRTRALPGQPFMGGRGQSPSMQDPSMHGHPMQGSSSQRQDLYLVPPGGFARQPAQLHSSRPRFYTAPASHGPTSWA